MNMAIVCVTLVLASTLLLQAMADDLVLDKNEFLIYNKRWHKARLRQWGPQWRDYGTWEHEIEDNQLWKFEPHPNKEGCYYIINEAYPRYRFADSKQNGLVLIKGSYADNQLFKVVPSGNNDEFYYIYSCALKNDRITKKSVKNKDIGRYGGSVKNDNQLWKLVSRFEADVYTDTIFHFNNLQGSTEISREISVTTGVVRTSESSVRSSTTYKASMEASIGGVKGSSEFTQQLETSFSSSTESSWSKTESIVFTIPAGKNFKVMQHKVKFDGVMPQDSCTLMTSIKIFESDSESFSDPENFII